MQQTREIISAIHTFAEKLPNAEKGTSLGKDIFQTGKKTFIFMDDEKEAVIVRTDLSGLDRLLEDQDTFKPPFCSKKTPWIGFNLHQNTDLDQLKDLTLKSYKTVAGKKSLEALNG